MGLYLNMDILKYKKKETIYITLGTYRGDVVTPFL